ncbi:uncharacterized protein BcabD6B2_22880 [Babesia caballi]|uniref:Uncharacterized protein n=1 Tax=Babesia caballi TaxID=5871 RepID=A0AAV4LSW1_BABCB|nr:hypothetical protein BcabD6B2_22880 [Babesia caballi]
MWRILHVGAAVVANHSQLRNVGLVAPQARGLRGARGDEALEVGVDERSEGASERPQGKQVVVREERDESREVLVEQQDGARDVGVGVRLGEGGAVVGAHDCRRPAGDEADDVGDGGVDGAGIVAEERSGGLGGEGLRALPDGEGQAVQRGETLGVGEVVQDAGREHTVGGGEKRLSGERGFDGLGEAASATDQTREQPVAGRFCVRGDVAGDFALAQPHEVVGRRLGAAGHQGGVGVPQLEEEKAIVDPRKGGADIDIRFQ